jgi:hypothetical protein
MRGVGRNAVTGVLVAAVVLGCFAALSPRAQASPHGVIRVTIVGDNGKLIHLDDGHQVCPIDPAHVHRVNKQRTSSSAGACGTVRNGVATLDPVKPGRWQLRLYRGIADGFCFNRRAKAAPCTLTHVVAGATRHRHFDPMARTARITLFDDTPARLKITLGNDDPIGTWLLHSQQRKHIVYTTHDPTLNSGGDSYSVVEPVHPGCGAGDEGSFVEPRHRYVFKVSVSGGSRCTDENGGHGYGIDVTYVRKS